MFSETLETPLNAELDQHLGYSKNENSIEHTTNRRNGKSAKTVQSQLREFDLNIPRDREASFEPQVVQKHQKDISGIEEKILSMYAKGQSQRDISATIEDILSISLDGLRGLEKAIKSVFPNTITQRKMHRPSSA